jgi:hypothetical protein
MLKEIETQKEVTWASISNGSIVVKSDASDSKAVKRINKKGVEVYERFYASIMGTIKTISLEDNIFGEKEIKIGILFGENNGVLTIKFDTSYGRSFLAQIFNVDLTKTISFNPWQKKTDGTTKSALYLNYTNREKVEWKYPDNTPRVNFVAVKDKKIIDNISLINHQTFLEEKLLDFISANGLEYIKEKNELPENLKHLQAPLTKEEKKELENLKKNPQPIEVDDFFNSL